MAKEIAQFSLKRVLHHNTAPVTDIVYEPGDQVIIWREKVVENHIGEWLVPCTVTGFDKQARIVFVQRDIESLHDRYNVVQVKPILEADTCAIEFLDIPRNSKKNVS